MFTIDQITTFDHEICDDNGTVYPVGTKFMVREVTLLDDPIEQMILKTVRNYMEL